MLLKSNFKTDLAREKKLATLLDFYYQKHLRFYDFERVYDQKQQMKGVDLVFTNKKTKAIVYIDEKAQLDYVNESLPTFAFELLYQKNGVNKFGWFFDSSKTTHFYGLVTGIYADEDGVYTSCNITFVNRQKLILYLEKRGLTHAFFQQIIAENNGFHGKYILKTLNPKTEGYLFFSKKNKAENPVNLILRLAFLHKIGAGKRLV